MFLIIQTKAWESHADWKDGKQPVFISPECWAGDEDVLGEGLSLEARAKKELDSAINLSRRKTQKL